MDNRLLINQPVRPGKIINNKQHLIGIVEIYLLGVDKKVWEYI